MTEQVKVIHVVGQTSRQMQKGNMMIHHSIGFNPNHSVFAEASSDFRIDAAKLTDVDSAPGEINRVIRSCFIHSAPVYIFFPLDMVDEQVPAALLDTPIDLSPPSNEDVKRNMEAACTVVVHAISEAKRPAVFVDGLIHRHNAVAEFMQLAEKLQFPIYTSFMAKGIVDESHPLHVGVYSGAGSSPGIAEAIEASDLILVFGHLPADTNTGGFSQKLPWEKKINFTTTSVNVCRVGGWRSDG